MSAPPLPPVLECGAVLADLLEQVAEGHADELTSHQAGCPYCKLTLTQAADSWRAVEGLRAEPVQPSPQLLARVMQRTWAGLEDWQIEVGGERGVTRISRAVLTSLAFWTASAAPGVREVFGARPTGTDVQRAGPSKRTGGHLRSPHNLRIELELSLHYGFNALVVAEEVRRAVIDQVREVAGLDLAGVELLITDVG
ncbi:MAG: Asp23/Gls24 family envelope stress response protein [Candidatus Dormibacteraeota bacterium]|nr:Asp23/Gls24 family envelope stress response protein [Candidatus Dormibacteraeota bacterium]